MSWRARRNVRWKAIAEVPSLREWWTTNAAVKRWALVRSVKTQSFHIGEPREKRVLC